LPHAAPRPETGHPLSPVSLPYRCCFLVCHCTEKCAIAQKNVPLHRKMCNRSGIVYPLLLENAPPEISPKISLPYNPLIKKKNRIL
jgi:hypothetical protein